MHVHNKRLTLRNDKSNLAQENDVPIKQSKRIKQCSSLRSSTIKKSPKDSSKDDGRASNAKIRLNQSDSQGKRNLALVERFSINQGDMMPTKKSTGHKYSKGAGKAVKSAIHRKKKGTLKSGKAGKGGKVKSRKQAIAIGLSEARKKGAKVPKKK
jgi:hypothetical protein